MSATATFSEPPASRPALRLLDGCGSATPEIVCHASERRMRDSRPALRLLHTQPRVLVAAADASQRGSVREELTRTLSPGTVIEEAGEMCEVLEHAPATRMVIVAGDLGDASAEVLTRLLGRTHPSLPVITLGERTSRPPLRARSTACV
ncbi:MAG TPA: hypothetical protein VLJ42_05720 [Solirubrobacteraceae bacterium]|nr:hypothetical protein [Solirubrobacteraceae bacterium]